MDIYNNKNISTATIATTTRDFGNKLSFNSVPSSRKRAKRATNYQITATRLSSSTQSPLLELPPLIWVHILQYCTVHELVVLPIVCSTFRDILSPRTRSISSTAIANSSTTDQNNSIGGKRKKPEDTPWDRTIWDTLKFKTFSWKRGKQPR